MSSTCVLRITAHDYRSLISHLYPGDGDEHGAVILAGMSGSDDNLTLHAREIVCARDGIDYVAGKVGYRALTPQFIHRQITRARDERLVYLAVHNHHPARRVGFSDVDITSHETGYPALLQIARGMPVGALVSGRDSLEADIWLPSGKRLTLDKASVVGTTIHTIRPRPLEGVSSAFQRHEFERQVRMFGRAGQHKLSECQVSVVGLGGVGSLVAEYLVRLGIRDFILVDDDSVHITNLSRLVGATAEDARMGAQKTEVITRMIHDFDRNARVQAINSDVATSAVAKVVAKSDFVFLAADSMRARLVVNAIVNQYLIPGVQMGAKISSSDGKLTEVLSVVRPMRPGGGCLWCNQFIDPTLLATEAKTDEERKDQAYGVSEPNPSVITLNAVSASVAVNDFLLDYLGLRDDVDVMYQHFHHLRHRLALVKPRQDASCPECSQTGPRFARGDTSMLPTIN